MTVRMADGDGFRAGSAAVVLLTGPDRSTLEALGRRVVEERLAACVNVLGGLRSIYRWQGAVEEADEALALVKTTAGRLEALRERVLALHPYDTPEFVALAVDAGSEDYLRWIEESVPARDGGP